MWSPRIARGELDALSSCFIDVAGNLEPLASGDAGAFAQLKLRPSG